MEIPETKRFIPKGFELDRSILGRKIEWELGPVPTLIWCNNNCIISMKGFVGVIFFKQLQKLFVI